MSLLEISIIGFLAQIIDGTLGMSYGIVPTLLGLFEITKPEEMRRRIGRHEIK